MSNTSIVNSIRLRLEKLNPLQLDEVERLVSRLEFNCSASSLPDTAGAFSWPHAPLHRLGERGVIMVTGATYRKSHFFKDASSLDFLQATLLRIADEQKWRLEAWACFSNHYHFVANSEEATCSLDSFIQQLHSQTGAMQNGKDGTKGRTVWFNYFDTQLTFHNSYMARLNYVHQNAVRHRLVPVANQYKWCSAAWFERTATPAQVNTVYSFKTDRVQVFDDFDV